MNWINGKKTYIVCALTVLFNIALAWDGKITWDEAVNQSKIAVIGATIRHAISSSSTSK